MDTKTTSGLCSLNTEQLLFEEKPLYQPGLEEVRAGRWLQLTHCANLSKSVWSRVKTSKKRQK